MPLANSSFLFFNRYGEVRGSSDEASPFDWIKKRGARKCHSLVEESLMFGSVVISDVGAVETLTHLENSAITLHYDCFSLKQYISIE